MWHAGAQTRREDVFGAADPVRPVYDSPPELNRQTTVPAMGTVGVAYRPGSLAFVSVNPAGGKPDAKSTPLDDELYRAIEQLRDAIGSETQLEAFEKLVECFRHAIPT